MHDGRIKRIKGRIPGDIEFLVEIDYLRRMFSPDGNSISLILKDCTFFEYQSYEMMEKAVRVSDFNNFIDEEPIILFAKDKSEKLEISYVSEISATDGYLWIKYSDFSLKLDNGKDISCIELGVACDKYWDNWRRKAKENRKKWNNAIMKREKK